MQQGMVLCMDAQTMSCYVFIGQMKKRRGRYLCAAKILEKIFFK